EPELGLHPSMMAIVAEYAAAAAEKTQVVLSTHSAEFLSAMPKGVVPDVFVFKSEEGATKIDKLDGERLRYWLREYTLGNLFQTGELEGMA
ncbi:MAG: AAA family ATPase, partial [Myxococcales bacterium]|nr:AAA family ATPase [Myxococcales bacterium]